MAARVSHVQLALLACLMLTIAGDDGGGAAAAAACDADDQGKFIYRL